VRGDLTRRRGGAQLDSARKAALGGQTGEGADPRDQLALGDRTTLLHLNLPLAAVSVVLGADLVREVLDDLAVPYQQQVVVDRQRSGDLIEEDSHMLIAVAFAARMLLSGWSSRCAVPTGDGGGDHVAHGELGTPAQDCGRVGSHPDTGGVGTSYRGPSFSEAAVSSAMLAVYAASPSGGPAAWGPLPRSALWSV
jgi:hypothetical protein